MYFCFTSSDAEIPAYEKFLMLTTLKVWPIFKRTNHRPKLKIDSNIIFYIAGANVNSQRFVGTAKISKIQVINDHTTIDESDVIKKISKTILNNKNLDMILSLKDISYFKNKVQIKDIIDKLSFIVKKSHYGIYFQSGVSLINNNDFETIINSSDC